MKKSSESYFLPYQLKWLEDKSAVKLWEKSRQVGASFTQAFEDVEDMIAGRYPAVWFSSANISNAHEYILDCAKWARYLSIGAKNKNVKIIESELDIKNYSIEFANGGRINAMSSNPKTFRGKHGKIILDEFAFHDNPAQMMAAAKGSTTWGFPMRILSTHNGLNSKFNQFIKQIKAGKLKWSLHYIDIYLAVDQGLLDKIKRHATTKEERDEWIDNEIESYGDRALAMQELACIPADEATSLIPYDMFDACSSNKTLLSELNAITGDLYLGFDVARKKHLSVIWITEKIANVYHTRLKLELLNMRFAEQRRILYEYLSHPKMRRACIDETGLGMQLAEEALEKFGASKVEPVNFAGSTKESLAGPVMSKMDDRLFIVPDDNDTKEDFHSVKKITTANGRVRYDVAQSDVSGHADRFWAAALSLYASTEAITTVPTDIITASPHETISMLQGY